MRGSPVIQSVIITVVLGLLGFAGMHFIQAGATGMPEISNNENTSLQGGEISIEIECYFSDKPESYSFLRPDNATASDRLILKSNSSEESPVFHDVVLKNKADNVIWLDVQWASEKPHGSYFVELLISVGNQEPVIRTFRSSSNTLQGTIELDLTNLDDDE